MRSSLRSFLSALSLGLTLACAAGTVSCGRPAPRVGMVSGDQVTIGEEVAHVGEVRVHKKEEGGIVKMLVSAPGQQPRLVVVETLEREVRRSEVLAVEGTEAKKLRVTYLEKSKTSITNGQQRIVGSPVTAKVFIIDLLVGRTIITHEDGTPLGIGEERIVAEDFKPKSLIPEKLKNELKNPMRIGTKIDALGALLRRSLPATVEQAEITVVLTGVRDNPLGPVAVFSIAIDAVGPQDGMRVALSLKGEMLIRIADSIDISSDMAGDVGMLRQASEKYPAIKGAGRVRFVEKIELPQ